MRSEPPARDASSAPRRERWKAALAGVGAGSGGAPGGAVSAWMKLVDSATAAAV